MQRTKWSTNSLSESVLKLCLMYLWSHPISALLFLFLAVGASLFSLAPAVFVNIVTETLEKHQQVAISPVIFAGLILGLILNIIFNQWRIFQAKIIGCNLRTTVGNSLAPYLVTSSSSTDQEFTPTPIFSQHIDCYVNVFSTLSEALWATLSIFLSCLALVKLLGYAAFAGILVVIVAVPLTQRLGEIFSKSIRVVYAYRDKRISVLENLLRHRQEFIWEGLTKYTEEWILSIRKKEINARIHFSTVNAIANVLYTAVDVLVGIVAVSIVWIISSNNFTAPILFSSLIVLRTLQQPIGMIAHFQSQWGSIKESHEIIKVYAVNTAENDGYLIANNESNQEFSSLSENSFYLHLSNFDLSHFSALKQTRDIIPPVNAIFQQGDTIAIIGGTPSSRSELLYALSGRQLYQGVLWKDGQGRIQIPERLILPSLKTLPEMTVKEFITRGITGRNVEKCLSMVHLENEIGIKGSDQEIYNGGSHFSTGQRKRLILACSVDAPEPVIFFEEPTTALDHRTATTIIENLFFGNLEFRTRFFASSDLRITERCSWIIDLDTCILRKQNIKSKSLISQTNIYLDNENIKGEEDEVDFLSFKQDEQEIGDLVKDNIEANKDLPIASLAWMWNYFLEMLRRSPLESILSGLILPLSLFLVSAAPPIQDAWLAYWTQCSSSPRVESLNLLSRLCSSSVGSVTLYIVLGICVILFSYWQDFIWRWFALKSSQEIFGDIVNSLLHKIQNISQKGQEKNFMANLTHDIDTLDREISWGMEASAFSFGQTGAAIIVAGLASPTIVIAGGLFVIVLIPLARMYARIMSNWNKKQFEVRAQSLRTVQNLSLTWFQIINRTNLQKACNLLLFHFRNVEKAIVGQAVDERKFATLVSGMSITLPIGLSFALCFSKTFSSSAPSSTMALALTLLFSLTQSTAQCVYAISTTFPNLLAWKRLELLNIKEIKVPQNIKIVVQNPEKNKPLPVLKLENVTARYWGGSVDIFQESNLCIIKGEKLAIVGRTGIGKSSIVNLLLGKLEILKGSVYLLKTLETFYKENVESKPLILALPPQPILLREISKRLYCEKNIDLNTIENLIEMWHLPWKLNSDDFLNNNTNDLTMNTESEFKFSNVGLSIINALLRSPEILILDETLQNEPLLYIDNFLHTLRKYFPEMTLIVITHRTDICNCFDRVIEMNINRSFIELSPKDLQRIIN